VALSVEGVRWREVEEVLPRSVHMLHKRETDGRGAHRRQETRRVALTSSGGQRTQDAVVRVEYSADGGETWVNRNTRT
jgi:hypothetical protein